MEGKKKQDLYELLEVDKSADLAQIKKAYKKLALVSNFENDLIFIYQKHHPDKN